METTRKLKAMAKVSRITSRTPSSNRFILPLDSFPQMFLKMYEDVLDDGLKMVNRFENDLVHWNSQTKDDFRKDLRAWSQKAQKRFQELVRIVSFQYICSYLNNTC